MADGVGAPPLNAGALPPGDHFRNLVPSQVHGQVQGQVQGQGQDDDVPKKPRRHQVSRACVECRRQHAACDLQRPCGRCIRQGMESMCEDAPRKARAKRNYNSADSPTTSVSAQQQPQASTSYSDALSLPTAYRNSAPVAAMSPVIPTPDTQTVSNASPAIFDIPSNPLDWERAYASLFETPLDPPEYAHPDAFARVKNEPPQVVGVPGAVRFQNGDLPPEGGVEFYWEQLATLQQEHASLTQQLASVTEQLSGAAENSSISTGGPEEAAMIQADMQTNETDLKELERFAGIAGNALQATTRHLTDDMNWYTFPDGEVSEIPVSVWRSSPITCGNVLVEANDAFVKMLGLPLEMLRAGFTCHQLMTAACRDAEETGIPLCQRHWLRRTQINTASGLKDVFVSITPISNDVDLYFVIHFVEAAIEGEAQ